MTTTDTPAGAVRIPARELRKGDVISMGKIESATPGGDPGREYIAIRFESRIGIHGTAFPLDLEVVVFSRAALPFLLPAANLAVGDTIRTDSVRGMIRSITRCVPDVLTFEFIGNTRTYTCKPGALVERMHNAPVEVLNDLVTELRGLFEQWNQVADRLLDAADPETSALLAADMLADSRTRRECAAEVRALLARLQ